MSVRFVLAGLLSVCGVVTANAADLEWSRGHHHHRHDHHRHHHGWYARPPGMLVVYDYEPGVVIRSYWLPPLGHRHYFPTGTREPVLGRKENLSLRGHAPRAESFYRSWSNDAGIVSQKGVRLRQSESVPDDQPLDPDPRMTPELK